MRGNNDLIQSMKRLTFIALILVLNTTLSGAEPSTKIPWAQPQTFPEQQTPEEDLPLFERAMREERRRKEAGNTDPIDVESLKSSRTVVPVQSHKAQPDPSMTPQAEPFKTLEKGTEGPRVELVQKTLLALGFGLPAGADGDYGGQTVDAVKAFQSSLALPETGKLDERTYNLLAKMRPAKGKEVWEDLEASRSIPEAPVVKDSLVRVLVDLSEHRLFVYDATGKPERVFPVASGAKDTPTDAGIKVVTEKLEDPTALAEKLWPDSKGLAFGKRLIDLNWYDPDTGSWRVSDEELHGTYVLNSIGSYASHGCVRLTNDSIEWLYQNLNVGDIVVIRE